MSRGQYGLKNTTITMRVDKYVFLGKILKQSVSQIGRNKDMFITAVLAISAMMLISDYSS